MQQDTGMHPLSWGLLLSPLTLSGRWFSFDLKRVFSGLTGTPRCLRGKDTRGNQIKWIKSSTGSSVMSVCCRSQLCSAAVTEVNTLSLTVMLRPKTKIGHKTKDNRSINWNISGFPPEKMEASTSITGNLVLHTVSASLPTSVML